LMVNGGGMTFGNPGISTLEFKAVSGLLPSWGSKQTRAACC